MQVHTPNNDFIKEEAERIRKQQAEQGYSDRELHYYDWKKGANNLRILPPWSAKGMHFIEVQTHFKIPPDRSIEKCLHTWPNAFQGCPICDAIDKVLRQLPELDLGLVKAARHYYGQAIDRDDEEKGPQIVRFTGKVRNWLLLQMDNPRIGDIADIENGLDLNVEVKEVFRKDGKTQTEYVPGLIPDRCPLHANDNTVAEFIKSMYDLDRIYAPLKDDKLQNVHQLASRLMQFYMRKYRDDYGDQSPVPGQGGNGQSGAAAQSSQPSQSQPPAQTAPPSQQAPASAQAPSEAPADPPAQRLDQIDPKTVPSCFAGLDVPEPHNDGSIGFNDTLEKCLLCKEELRCLDAKRRKAL